MDRENIYQDISTRTGGEIYLGVVGPVRSGKSTFIKRFIELMLLPEITDEHEKKRTMDELPQSGTGKSVMTTEPKFIPKDGTLITVDQIAMKVRLIDCVGFMIQGAGNQGESGKERLVKTPWFEEEIPFTKAAEIGTQKVITDHSTIGILVTTDASFTEFPREAYVEAEKKTVEELKKIGKPFIVILNSERPFAKEVKELAGALSRQYDTAVLPLNCDQLKTQDVLEVLRMILLEFPLSAVHIYLPKWVEMLSEEHWLKKSIIDSARAYLADKNKMKDVWNAKLFEQEYIAKSEISKIHMDTGNVDVQIQIKESYYYDILSDMTNLTIQNEYQLIQTLRELAKKKEEFEEVGNALQDARLRGYGVVRPAISDIKVSKPEVVKHAGKYGVKIKADAPSIHLIRANLSTEVAPIVGSESQAKDLIDYMREQSEGDAGKLWKVNIFGKTLDQLVSDGIASKVTRINEDSQEKLQNAMEKIVNESSGGLICIII